MSVAIEYLPETTHEEIHKKEALKQRCNRLGMDKKTTTEEQLIERESR